MHDLARNDSSSSEPRAFAMDEVPCRLTKTFEVTSEVQRRIIDDSVIADAALD